MSLNSDLPLPPTISKVLDRFLEVMKADAGIDDAAADRLDALLRSGKALKTEEIATALFLPADDSDGAEEDDA